MSLNWIRGLFRLWVLLSVLWIIGISVLALSQISLYRKISRYMNPDEIKICAKSNGLSNCEGPFHNFMTTHWDIVPVPDSMFTARWYIIAALGVPIGALLLAPVGRWIVAGFRGDRTNR